VSTGDDVEFVITYDRADGLVDALEGLGASVEASQSRGYDGAQVADWLAVVTAAIPAIPAILAELRKFIQRGEIDSVRYGDLVIKHPRPEDLDRIVERVTDRD
jgi:hypothetical protein